eukprot:TRINITY_DN5519_c0_g1_i1.p1 TRINITY_DN5519_c0_g1~~TRINITY_DN5519_c0_g1_i1.p1  ORF type:complete len:389 (-),score=93.84 TRINITY_DN5519_c0_g1_i1:36-1202(-)
MRKLNCLPHRGRGIYKKWVGCVKRSIQKQGCETFLSETVRHGTAPTSTMKSRFHFKGWLRGHRKTWPRSIATLLEIEYENDDEPTKPTKSYLNKISSIAQRIPQSDLEHVVALILDGKYDPEKGDSDAWTNALYALGMIVEKHPDWTLTSMDLTALANLYCLYPCAEYFNGSFDYFASKLGQPMYEILKSILWDRHLHYIHRMAASETLSTMGRDGSNNFRKLLGDMCIEFLSQEDLPRDDPTIAALMAEILGGFKRTDSEPVVRSAFKRNCLDLDILSFREWMVATFGDYNEDDEVVKQTYSGREKRALESSKEERREPDIAVFKQLAKNIQKMSQDPEWMAAVGRESPEARATLEQLIQDVEELKQLELEEKKQSEKKIGKIAETE